MLYAGSRKSLDGRGVRVLPVSTIFPRKNREQICGLPSGSPQARVKQGVAKRREQEVGGHRRREDNCGNRAEREPPNIGCALTHDGCEVWPNRGFNATIHASRKYAEVGTKITREMLWPTCAIREPDRGHPFTGGFRAGGRGPETDYSEFVFAEADLRFVGGRFVWPGVGVKSFNSSLPSVSELRRPNIPLP